MGKKWLEVSLVIDRIEQGSQGSGDDDCIDRTRCDCQIKGRFDTLKAAKTFFETHQQIPQD